MRRLGLRRRARPTREAPRRRSRPASLAWLASFGPFVSLALLASFTPLTSFSAPGVSAQPASAAPGAHVANEDLQTLMRLLAARRHGRADFIEQHFLAVLERPVESYGVMTYDAPSRLEKRTIEPRPEILLLDGDELTVERKGHTRVLDLASYPSILPFVESLRATLAGDLPALERSFDVDFAGSLDRWTLALAPRDPKIARTFRRVLIDGSRDVLLTVEILEANGDRSLMTLRNHPSP